MTNLGYKQSQGDHTLFIKHSVSGGVTILLVYVDDIIVTGDDKEEQIILSQCLATNFEIKTLGRLKYFWELKWPIPRKEFSYLNKNILLICLKKQGRQPANQ